MIHSQFAEPLELPAAVGMAVGRYANPVPQSPVDAERRQVPFAAIPGQTVKKRVGRRIVGLPGRSRDRRHRTAKYEEVESQMSRVNVKVPSALGLGLQHAEESLGALAHYDGVVQYAGGMNHTLEGCDVRIDAGDQRGDLPIVRHVEPFNNDPSTALFQFL